MPTVHVLTNAAASAQPPLLSSLSRAVAEATGKDERWVMTALSPAVGMTFGGEPGPTCFVRVVSIGGFTDEVARGLVRAITSEVETHLGVPPERTYVELSAAERSRFGHRGVPFA